MLRFVSYGKAASHKDDFCAVKPYVQKLLRQTQTRMYIKNFNARFYLRKFLKMKRCLRTGTNELFCRKSHQSSSRSSQNFEPKSERIPLRPHRYVIRVFIEFSNFDRDKYHVDIVQMAERRKIR